MSGRGTHEQQVADVGARYQQHKCDGAKQREDGSSQFADRIFSDGYKTNAISGIACRVLFFQPGGNQAHLRLRLIESYIRF
jgi:hypothetical protein